MLARFRKDRNVQQTPNTAYKFITQISREGHQAAGRRRCGAVRAVRRADPRADGVPPDHPRPRQGRARTHQGHMGSVAARRAPPESNVQFGEGGAGTFSDGKLYSRIKDPRHLDRKVLTEFVKAGAPPEILTEAHPHIGTFRLVTMVESLRETIEGLGGEYRWQHEVDGLDIASDGAGERPRARGCTSPMATISKPTASSSPWAIARATPLRCCRRRGCMSRRSPFRSASASSIRNRGSTPRASVPMRAIPYWAPPNIISRTTAGTGAPSTASACAPAAPSSPRRPRKGASRPTA